MSSFIIGKIEYIRCAGMVHGILDTFRGVNADFKRSLQPKMTKVYENNVKSFNLQYDEHYVPDSKEYTNEYEEYRRKGFMLNTTQQRDMFFKIIHFFNSASYQIEDETCSAQAAEVFWYITTSLISFIFRSEIRKQTNWGEFDEEDEGGE